MYLTTEAKKEMFKKFGGSETNTGSVEGQVAVLTFKIKHLTEHLKENRKDFNTLRSLNMMVSKRKKLLKYLSHKDLNGYRTLIKELGLRK